jgi:hypothetical protein
MLSVRYEHYLYIESTAIPITGRRGLQRCEMLLSNCLDNRLTDGGEVVSLMGRPFSTPQKHYFFCFGYSFLFEAEEKSRGLLRMEGLGKVWGEGGTASVV